MARSRLLSALFLFVVLFSVASAKPSPVARKAKAKLSKSKDGVGTNPFKNIKVPSALTKVFDGDGDLLGIDPPLAAKIMGCWYIVNGVLTFIAPGRSGEILGQSPALCMRSLTVCKAAFMMGMGIMTLSSVCDCLETTKALGYSFLPLLGLCLFMAGEFQSEWGVTIPVMGLMTVFCSVGMYASLCGVPWGGTALKAAAAAFSVESLMLIFDPQKPFQIIGAEKPLADINFLSCSRFIGIFEAQFSVLMGALAWGLEPLKAVGYSILPIIPFNLWVTYGGLAADMGLKFPVLTFFLIVNSLAAACLLL